MHIITEDHGAWRDSRGRKHTEWSAIDSDTYDGAEDAHSPIGLGATEEEAIADLMDQIEEGDRAVVSDGSTMFLRVLRAKRDATEHELDAVPYLAPWLTAPQRLLLAMLNAEIARRAALPPPVLTETERVDAMRRELRRVAALQRAFAALGRAQLPQE